MSVPNYFEAVEQPGGAKIAADGITDAADGLAKRVQVIKIAGGPLDAYEIVPGTAARGLLVEVSGYGSTIRSSGGNATTTGQLLSAITGVAALANRKNIQIMNIGTARAYIGHAAGQETWPLDPNVPYSQDWAAAINPYIRASTGTQSIVVMETA
jgi:hypothetical protein